MRVEFSVQNDTDNVLKKIEADFNGDGVMDFSTPDESSPITFTYAMPGTYQARFNLTGDRDIVYQKSVTIVVVDPARIDNMLMGQWAEMVEALTRGEKERAISYFGETSQKKYTDIFDKLMPQMSDIFRTASSLQKISLDQRIGEYAINRIVGGENRIFFVYFLRDDDGVWRIDSL